MDIDMEICQSTIGQQASERWWKERACRITASRFGRVMSARNDDSLKQLSVDMGAGQRSYVPAACRMGIAEEENAKKAYIQYKREVEGKNVHVSPVGLCVPNSSPSIASSPDGIVTGEGVPHVLEIKCIHDTNVYPKSIVEIAKQRKSSFYCQVDSEGVLSLRQNHQYYYQVMGEMATTGLLVADFVIYHPRTAEIKVLQVPFDSEVWAKIKVKLDYFTQKFLSQ